MLSTAGAAGAIHSAVTDSELMTLVVGKRRSLLMAGDDDEVYNKKHQRYIKDNGAAFNQSINQSKHISIAPYVATNQRRMWQLELG